MSLNSDKEGEYGAQRAMIIYENGAHERVAVAVAVALATKRIDFEQKNSFSFSIYMIFKEKLGLGLFLISFIIINYFFFMGFEVVWHEKK